MLTELLEMAMRMKGIVEIFNVIGWAIIIFVGGTIFYVLTRECSLKKDKK